MTPIPKEWILTQGFGEHPEWYLPTTNGHPGFDFGYKYGAPIPALYDGKIAHINYNKNGYGNSVEMICPLGDRLLFVNMGHMTENQIVHAGQEVKAGETIGYMGNSGYVVDKNGVAHYGQSDPTKGGVHVHITFKWLREWKPEDGQARFFDDNSHPYMIEQFNNGFLGAFDPLEILNMQLSNVEFVHKKGTQEYGFYVPAMTEDALKDKAKNFGITILNVDGNAIDYTKARDI